MTLLFAIVFPLATSLLFLKVFRLAGFAGAVLLVCFAPVLGAVLPYGAFMLSSLNVFNTVLNESFSDLTFMWFIGARAFGVFLGLLPVLVLAFLQWPARAVSK